MPLEILALLVVFGVGGVVLAIHMTGGTVDAVVQSSEAAERRFAEDFPELPVGRVIVAADGQTAFLSIGGNQLGIVHTIGDRFLTRLLTAENPVEVEMLGEAKLLLRLNDISWRGGEFEFSTPDDRSEVNSMLTRLRIGDDRDG